MNIIEDQRTKETPKFSPAGLACGRKYVNANKYIKRQLANLNSQNLISDATNKSRKLSPRLISTKKCNVNDKNTLKESISSRSPCGSFKYNETSFEETNTIQSSKFNINSHATSNFNYYIGTSNQGFVHSTSDSISSNISFEKNSYITSDSSNYNEDARHRNPPKFVFDDTNVAETDSTMSTVFNWVCNCLSPMKNPSIYELLARVGMQKYWDIFEKEEILDLYVFSTLTMADLEAIGIKDTKDCVKILKSVGWAIDFLSGLLNFKRPEK